MFNKNSATYTEQFDGENVTHSLNFGIKFDDYKSSWHYNLLEFTENKYAAIIKSTCGKYILTGFHFGLQPSFTVNANDDVTMDNIEIAMIDFNDNGHQSTTVYDEVSMAKNQDVGYIYTTEHNGWECVAENTARYLLKKELDAFGNPTGRYMCLNGYVDRFSDLNIVGTFANTENFANPNCHGASCMLQTSFPNEFIFNTQGCRTYSLLSDSVWSITSSNPSITVTPSNGLANHSYDVEVCNTLSPSSDVTETLTLTYCNTSKEYLVKVKQGNPCFTAGQVFDISANGQYVTVPIQCCVRALFYDSTLISNATIQSTYFKVYVNENSSGALRTITVGVVFCDGAEADVTINQGVGFERWVNEGTTCVGAEKCDVERKYTGTTASDINTRTDETRTVNCSASTECGGITTRWVDSTKTTCSGGKKYVVQIEQVSYDGGQTWSTTGNERLGGETQDSPAECAEPTQDWRNVSGYLCNGTNKYARQELYIDNVAQGVYRMGAIIEYDSVDCGYDPSITGYTYQKTQVEGYVCNEYDKHERLRLYVSNDYVTWSGTSVYYVGNVIEYNSTDCGYVPQYEYRWVLTQMATCVGYDKYYLYKQQRRASGGSWEDVVPTKTSYDGEGTMTPSLIEADSRDCGYVPPTPDPQYDWKVVPNDFVCDSCEGTEEYAMMYTYYTDDPTNIQTGHTPFTDTITSDSYSGNIVSAKISTCVTDIDDNAFNSCGDLKLVDMPDSVTSIGASAFEYCIDLIDMTLPNSVTSIGNSAFNGCTQLSSIFIPNSATSIGQSAFTSCQNIQYLNIPSGVTSIGQYAFSDCQGLSDIIIPNTVTSIGNSAFYGCNGATYLTIGSGVTSIGDDAFRNCTRLVRLSIPNSVTTIGTGAFYHCSGLTSCTIGSGVTTIGALAFESCSSLSSITIGSGVTSIGNKAFWYCSGLTSITINAATPPTLGTDVFHNTNDSPIYVPCESVNAYRTASGWSTYASRIHGIPPCDEPTPPTNIKFSATYSDSQTYSKECDSSTSLTSGETKPSGYDYSAMTSAVIGDCVTSISSLAFSNCSGLTEVTIPNGVTSIGASAFYWCSSLTSVTIPNSVTSISYNAFQYCESLTSVTIPSGVTSIGQYAFRDCTSLTSITVNATTPPTLGMYVFNDTNNCPIYVPSSSVNAYKTANRWSSYASRIQPIT